MGAWDVKGPARGTVRSWRELVPGLQQQVERISAPMGRGIAWEGTEIWAWRERRRNGSGMRLS